KLTHLLLTLVALIASVSATWAQTVPDVGGASNLPSPHKPGSLLFWDIYTSKVGDPSENTRLSITNSHPTRPVNVHLFFVRKSDCTIADTYLCLTANQTFSFLASEYDPNETGFMFAVATDVNGVPVSHNYLLGDLYVKSTFGTTAYFQASLGAMAFSARKLYRGDGAPLNNLPDWPDGQPSGTFANGSRAALAYGNYRDENSLTTPHALYDQIPCRLAIDNIQSPVDGNNTLMILHSMQGTVEQAGAIGQLIGLVYNDAERGFSYQLRGFNCLETRLINDNLIRVPNGFSKVIPSGRTGWMYLQSSINNNAGQPNLGLIGATLVSNNKAATDKAAFNGGHHMHFLAAKQNPGFAIPVIPSTTCTNF
ncbi:MAG TPA: hypothetical protein VFZ34_09050, partial [Blastocatellia bacterium]|nr:hypothetical protein [Blastocatellia bacterium]